MFRELRFKVKGQSITKDESCDFQNIVSGSDNYLLCVFYFESAYREFGKVAEFTNDTGESKLVLLNNDKCTVSKEITEGSYFKIKVHLKKGNIAFSTNEVVVIQT